jgi:putative ABC transport system permease protein
MKESNNIHPPRWAERFLSWYCRPELLEDLQGDLNEYLERNAKTKGIRQAKLIYVADVLKFFRSYTIRKPQSINPLNSLDLLQNNFKASWRNISRNKLFATINVLGLAIAMCVGLIIITLITELKSFDTFHEKFDQIYRVRNTVYETPSYGEQYASTSLQAAKQIKETVSGIDEATIIQNGFNKDVQYENKTIPLNGLWADESFFNVFTFRFITGSAFTALRDLNSVVLTEKSALKIFGTSDVAGKSVIIDSTNFLVSAVIENPPMNSHLRFDMLGSFITLDTKKIANKDKDWMKWDEMWFTYIYLIIPSSQNTSSIRQSLSVLSAEGNKTISTHPIELQLQPLNEIVLGNPLVMEIGPTHSKLILWVLGIFAFIVILSACFNYTNLSIARALRRTREVGIRKVAGASWFQVFQQFILEAMLLSFLSLILAYGLFLMVRSEFISMDATFQEMVTLIPPAQVYLYFGGMAIGVGIFAGLLPALFFSKVSTIQVLKDLSSIKLFKYVNLRKGLIIFQYSLSLLFIVAVTIEYKQYQYSMNFNLGFTTDNILTLDLQKNKSQLLEKEFSEIAEVKQIAKSNYITSVGVSGTPYSMRYQSTDSVDLKFNFIDEHYLTMHDHQLIAGKNFSSSTIAQHDIIINEKIVKWMKINDPQQAIGEDLIFGGSKYKIVGVIKDFNYDRINHPIQFFAFVNDPAQLEMMSLKIQSSDMVATMEKIRAAWKKIDPIHPLRAEFYNESIGVAYNKLSWMAKMIGSIALLAIFIASLGLLGMVIFTTETRLKEISIRKVLGASEGGLILLISKGFIQLILVSAFIAIPAAYYLFDQIIFATHAYRAPIGIIELFGGLVLVIGVAMIMISSQTLKVARLNPAHVLKTE